MSSLSIIIDISRTVWGTRSLLSSAYQRFWFQGQAEEAQGSVLTATLRCMQLCLHCVMSVSSGVIYTNSMEQSSLWETNCRSASQEVAAFWGTNWISLCKREHATGPWPESDLTSPHVTPCFFKIGRVQSSALERRVDRWKSTDILLEHNASIFRVEVVTDQETSVKAGGKQGPLTTCFRAGFLFLLFFDPEDGRNMSLRNVRWLSTDYTALHRRNSYPRLWELLVLHTFR
jgi:hypothetical protein